MSKNFEEIFDLNDRTVNESNIKKIIKFIKDKYNFSINPVYLKDGSFLDTQQFKALSLDIKKSILSDLIKINFSISHILQNQVKNLISAKEQYKDNEWYQYDKNELLNYGIVDQIEFDDNGVINLNGLLGNLTFYSLCNKNIQNNNSIEISPLSDYQPMCFSNVIDMIELNKKGKISVIQISNAIKTYFHAVYINNEIVYDLNYYVAYPLEQLSKLYQYKLMKEIDFDTLERAKGKFLYTKPESLIVAISIFDDFDSAQSMIEYLDNFENFQSRKK